MTHDELERRRPLWDAMSDLFLDTEVRWSVPYVARRCVESGYDAEVLERIFWVEVFPEAIGNLLQVAGEWAGLVLNEKALVRRANENKVPWLSRRATGWMVEKEWLAVREVTKWLRVRPELEPALNAVGRRFFGGTAEDHPLFEEARRLYEPLCRSMLLEDEKPPLHRGGEGWG
ncbi:MAG: DUF7079 family protein [Archangium sp.]